MLRKYRGSWGPAGTVVAMLMLLPLGCGDDSGPSGPGEGQSTFPASWGGQWSVTSMAMVGDQQITETDQVLICPNESVAFVESMMVGQYGTFELTCDGTITDTTFDWACSGPGTGSLAGSTLTFDFSGTRDGDTFEWIGSMTMNMSGIDLTAPLTMTGTRTSTSTAGCPGAANPLRLPTRVFEGLAP